MKKSIIKSIRILPNDKKTFPKENDFQYFIEYVLKSRNGYYYTQSSLMKCQLPTLVLFQYNGMIRAIGILVNIAKTKCFDEIGNSYSGYYQFDINSLHFLINPIGKLEMKSIYPIFKNFSQAKQNIDISYLDEIINLLK